jgi:UDP-2-acetamido-2-deoxy-ribo-hexuluronate aminotransferase
MELFPNEVPLREKVGKRYTELLKGKVKTPTALADRGHVYAQYTIEVENRDVFIKKMTELGIPTAVHYPKPLHLQPVFDKKYAEGRGAYPISERAGERVVSLPMYPALSNADQDQIVKAVLASV